jgi:LysR substrate binding domain
MAEYAEVALVQRLAESFARSAAWATLRIVPLTGAEVAERLDREVIDVAAAHLGPLPAHFDTTVLLMDPFVLVARRGHSLTARPVTVEAYAALSHVLVSPRGDTVGAVDRALAAQGLKRRIALLVATHLALPVVLGGSDLVAFVPQRTARHLTTAAGVAITPLPLDFSVTVSMAWHRRNRSDPAQTWSARSSLLRRRTALATCVSSPAAEGPARLNSNPHRTVVVRQHRATARQHRAMARPNTAVRRPNSAAVRRNRMTDCQHRAACPAAARDQPRNYRAPPCTGRT